MESTAAAELQSWLTEMADQTLELVEELDRVPGVVTVQAGPGPGVSTTRYHPLPGQVGLQVKNSNSHQPDIARRRRRRRRGFSPAQSSSMIALFSSASSVKTFLQGSVV